MPGINDDEIRHGCRKRSESMSEGQGKLSLFGHHANPPWRKRDFTWLQIERTPFENVPATPGRQGYPTEEQPHAFFHNTS